MVELGLKYLMLNFLSIEVNCCAKFSLDFDYLDFSYYFSLFPIVLQSKHCSIFYEHQCQSFIFSLVIFYSQPVLYD